MASENATVLTIFAGLPDPATLSQVAKDFHESCEQGDNSITLRKEEDLCAAAFLGFQAIHLDFLDCVYRQNSFGEHIYPNHEDIFAKKIVDSECFLKKIEDSIKFLIRKNHYDQIYLPLGAGDHTDHIITRVIAEKIFRTNDIKSDVFYYEDMPYTLNLANDITGYIEENFREEIHEFTEVFYRRKIDAIKLYLSQVKMLWANKGAEIMKLYEINSYIKPSKQRYYYERYWKRKNY